MFFKKREEDKFNREAKLMSRKAAQDRSKLDECTFTPQVNPLSTKIAYKQLEELHLGDSEFSKTYTKHLHELANQEGLTELQKTRIHTQMNKNIEEYTEERKNKQDISTEQIEYEKNKSELTFQPNIWKSKKSNKTSPKTTAEKKVE